MFLLRGKRQRKGRISHFFNHLINFLAHNLVAKQVIPEFGSQNHDLNIFVSGFLKVLTNQSEECEHSHWYLAKHL